MLGSDPPSPVCSRDLPLPHLSLSACGPHLYALGLLFCRQRIEGAAPQPLHLQESSGRLESSGGQEVRKADGFRWVWGMRQANNRSPLTRTSEVTPLAKILMFDQERRGRTEEGEGEGKGPVKRC